jgi:hypothetical protein
MPYVCAERRIGLVVSEFDEDRRLLVVWREGMNGQFPEPAAEIPAAMVSVHPIRNSPAPGLIRNSTREELAPEWGPGRLQGLR